MSKTYLDHKELYPAVMFIPFGTTLQVTLSHCLTNILLSVSGLAGHLLYNKFSSTD